MTNPQWNFIFFRSCPDSKEASAALTSSMQSLDSVLLLIALQRFPHALCTCVAAIESAIKSSRLRSALAKSNGLAAVVKVARPESAELMEFPEEQLTALGKARNRITHEGFIPRDDSEAVGLLIEVGIPFLAVCYQHFYSFDLWDAILQEYAHQWRIGTGVFQRAKEVSDLDCTYCLNGLIHLIRWNLRENFSADWEIKATVETAENGVQFAFNYKRREYFERLYALSWVFDCPLCRQPEAAVCELDSDELESKNVIPLRMACINCGFVVGKAQPFLTEALLELNVARAKEKILKGCGLM